MYIKIIKNAKYEFDLDRLLMDSILQLGLVNQNHHILLGGMLKFGDCLFQTLINLLINLLSSNEFILILYLFLMLFLFFVSAIAPFFDC
jgi:hypothetical protein